MTFCMEVRRSAHTQVPCLTAVLKRLHGLELCDWPGSSQCLLYCYTHKKQSCDHSVDLEKIRMSEITGVLFASIFLS